MEILKELWTGDCEDEIRNTYQYVLELRTRLEETCQLLRESLYEAQGCQKHHYDKKARNRQFKVGQKVLVLLSTDSNKLVLTAYQEREASEVEMTVHEEECHSTTAIKEEGEGDDVMKDG